LETVLKPTVLPNELARETPCPVDFTIRLADGKQLTGRAVIADVYHHPIERTMEDVVIICDDGTFTPTNRPSGWDITLRGIGKLILESTE
jgi:hypothetical protein